MTRLRLLPIAFLLGMAAAQAGQHISAFDGRSLAGWHAQGDCQWSVVGGALRGVDPHGHWCHLVTDSSYADFSLRLEYRIVQGNSGVFVRAGGEDSGCCGLEGTQVDFGPSQDGSVMWVRDGSWGWYELITRAVTERWVDYAAWNVLDVDVQGSTIRTVVNGHQVYASAKLDKMAARGSIALQLHSGGVNDTVLFRNLDLYLPKRMPGCLDPAFAEFDPQANFPAAELCKTRKPVSIAARPRRAFRRARSGMRAPTGAGAGFDARGRHADFP